MTVSSKQLDFEAFSDEEFKPFGLMLMMFDDPPMSFKFISCFFSLKNSSFGLVVFCLKSWTTPKILWLEFLTRNSFHSCFGNLAHLVIIKIAIIFFYFRLNIGLDSSVNTANQGSLVTNKDKNDVIFT